MSTTPQDEWARRFDELLAGAAPDAPAPADVPQLAPLALPFPVSLSDVTSIYAVAMNYAHTAMKSGLNAEGAEMMARHLVNTMRAAAGLEAMTWFMERERQHAQHPPKEE